MDSKYLQEQLGDVLTLALAEVCEKRPADPVEYLAQWLYRKKKDQETLKQDMKDELELYLESKEVKSSD